MQTTKLPISVTIICQNEADRIRETIDRVVNWVDEVIVVDSGSDDGTPELAQQSGAKVLHNDWPGYGQQKRFAEDQARNDWILNIDADERVLTELEQELKALFAQDKPEMDGFKIPIYDRYLCTRQLSKNRPYNPVRLYRKSVGRYRDSSVHDRVVMPDSARVGQLEGIIAHDSLKSFRHRVEKMNDYTDAQVNDLQAKGRSFSKLRITLEFWISFLNCYLIRGYWRNGFMGYIYSMNFAYSRFLRAIKLFEAESKKNQTDD